MVKYTPPTPADLKRLKEALGYTGHQMAALASVASDAQWRKYTGGMAPREVNLHMLFFIAARLCLTPEELHRIATQMQSLGAEVDSAALAERSCAPSSSPTADPPDLPRSGSHTPGHA